MSLWDMIITSQLLPPDRRRGVLIRRRLEERLAQVLDTPLTLVQAGTGYGKSTALAGLVAQAPDVFWYTIGKPERDPLLFLAHLLAAFDQGNHPWGKPFLNHLEEMGGRASSGALNFLLNTLTQNVHQDLVLVLDDIHLVADVPEVLALIEHLVDYRAPGMHIVLSGRQIPPFSALTRWRVKGLVMTIDRTDLAFTVDEITQLFHELYGIDLTPTQATELAIETEGWAIALQMIGQRLKRGAPASLEEVLRHLPSEMEELFEYLAQEVLASQPPETQDFLLKTAVLRQMSGPICDALTGQKNSALTLRQLHDSGLFVTGVEAEVYRYQHLFNDFLLARLNQNPQQAQELNRRAALIFRQNNNPEESIYHLIKAGDSDEVAAQLEELGPELLAVGRLGSLTYWITHLDAHVVDEHPRLHLLLGDVLRLRSQFDDAIAQYQAAESAFTARGDALGRSQALRSQAQVYLDTVRPLRANSLLEEALRLLEPQMYPREVAGLLEQLAENQLNLGLPVQAQALHQEARLLNAEATPSGFYQEARALLRTGWLADAQRLLEEHEEGVNQAVHRPQRFHRETPLLLSLVCVMQGKVEEAEKSALLGREIGMRLESAFVEAVALMRIGHAWQLDAIKPWTKDKLKQAAEAYHKAIDLVRPFKVTRVQVEPLWGLCRLAGYQGEVSEAVRQATLAIDIAEQAGDLWFASLIRTVVGASMVMAGQGIQAQPWLTRAAEGSLQVKDLFNWAAAKLWLALNAWGQGQEEEAMHRMEELLPVTRQRYASCLLTDCTLLGLKDDQAVLPLLIEARRRGIEPVYLDEILGRLNLLGENYHPGYSLVVRTLGSFEVWRGGTVITPRDWQREKARQLFQFFLTHRGVWMSREQIVDRLWPYLDADAAAQNFKVALNALNRALEPARPVGAQPFIIIRRENNTYMINPLARLRIDADEFELAAASEQPDELRRALAIYEEDYLTDCLGEEWAEAKRERLRQLYLMAAERLAELQRAAHSYEDVLALANKMLERDRCWEKAYRLMMLAYAGLGSRAQAQAAYNRCAAILQEELDVEPSPETQALMEKLVGEGRSRG